MDKEPTPILSLEELCEQLSIGKNAAYELLRSGKSKPLELNGYGRFLKPVSTSTSKLL